jgi:hypothetical protein
MKRYFKINTAVLICMAFVFKLLFINISITTSLNSGSNKTAIKTHLSSLMKRRRASEITNNVLTGEYSSTEICEEAVEDENDISKVNSFAFIQVLYSSLANKILSLRSAIPLDHIYSKLSSRKYLSISVLRI